MGLRLWGRIESDMTEATLALMKVKEESEESGFILNIQKTRIVVSGPITSWQIDGEKMETVTDYFLGLQNQCRQ